MTGNPKDICICTMDLAGPIRNGGIGTAYAALAKLLAAAGHRVTVLLVLGDYCENGPLSQWIESYRKLNIELIPMPPATENVSAGGGDVAASFNCYQWLAAQENAGRVFDFIHFHEWRGPGFYTCLAKRQGLNFSRCVIVVGTHSPVLWHLLGMRRQPERLEEFQADWLERGSVRWTDKIVSPSRYMLDWIASQGWKLPDDPAAVEVIQYILTERLTPAELSAAPHRPIEEIVFFGRLETRKGLVLFCDALDILANQPDRKDFRVTFLGKVSRVEDANADAYLQRRGKAWPFSWRILGSLDHSGAMAYLKLPGRLAVAPSLVENLPLTVLECLGNAIPMLCTDLPGNRELVAANDADRVTFAPRPRALADKLQCAWSKGFKPALPAIHPEQTNAAWLTWHEKTSPTSLPAASPTKPLVSICMTHFNRPGKLAQALESVRQQDYPNLEVVLVDDGSDSPEAKSFLDSLEAEFTRRSWKLIRQENMYLGAARNAAANAARGQWLLFMDDDNYAMPDEISTFVHAAENSSAAILTCVPSYFHGDDPPRLGVTPRQLVPPLGGALTLGFFSNIFGDANGFFRRDVFEKLGGFTEDFGIGYEDWELYAKAALAGHEIMVVPRTLFWYRIDQKSMVRSTNRFENQMRSLRPYLQRLGPELGQALLLAQAMYFQPPVASAGAVAVVSDSNGNGHAEPQQTVDHYLDSLSWRLTGLARRTLGAMIGLPPAARPKVHNRQEALVVIETIRRSLSWEATGPLRAMGRIWSTIRNRRRSNGN